MLRTIANDILTVTVNDMGAELWSIRGETEYLWQGDPKVWAGRSPTIFPYVARLIDGKYTADGELYRLPIHGFGWCSVYTVSQQRKDSVTLELTDGKLTHVLYPWPFVFRVRYALTDNRLEIAYTVVNTGTRTMFFGLGGHPGFNVPLEESLRFEDYELRFSKPCRPRKVGFSADCFVTGADEPFPLEDGTTLRLRHGLFDNDAIVLKDAAKSVTLLSGKGKRGVRVTYPQMPYIGFWHMPRVNAPYVCIEPWSSLPAKKGEITEFSRQKDLIRLPAGKTYQNIWTIDIL